MPQSECHSTQLLKQQKQYRPHSSARIRRRPVPRRPTGEFTPHQPLAVSYKQSVDICSRSRNPAGSRSTRSSEPPAGATESSAGRQRRRWFERDREREDVTNIGTAIKHNQITKWWTAELTRRDLPQHSNTAMKTLLLNEFDYLTKAPSIGGFSHDCAFWLRMKDSRLWYLFYDLIFRIDDLENVSIVVL